MQLRASIHVVVYSVMWKLNFPIDFDGSVNKTK